MNKHDTRKRWLLLDPPSSSGYARRGSLREKLDAADAPFPSIDLIFLSGAVRDAGYAPVYLDAQVRRWDWTRLSREARRLNVEGIVMLLSSARIHDELAELGRLREVLGRPKVYVVATIQTMFGAARIESLLAERPWLDGIVLNTIENNFGEVITQDRVEPCNVALQRDGNVVMPSMKVTYGEGFAMPMPVHEIFLDRRYYFPQSKRTPVTCVQLSFGCPYTCEFCLDNALYRKMRYRDADEVIEELVEIDRLGFREVYFKDLTFGLNNRVTTDFLTKLAEKRLRLKWLCTTRVDVATDNLLQRMKKAGCYGIEFGVESGSRHRRAANGKPIDDGQIRTVFDHCRKLGIETTAFVMIGFEDETESEIKGTMRFIESIRPVYASYNIVNALPGTPLNERARREGFLRDDTSDHSFANTNIKNEHLTPEQLVALRHEALKSFYRRPAAAASRLLRLRSFFEFRKLLRLSRVAS